MQNNQDNNNPSQDLQDLYNIKRPNQINPNNEFNPQTNSINQDTTQTPYFQDDLVDQNIYQEVSSADESPVYIEEPAKKTNKLFYIITGIISLILLLIIGILGYLIYNSSLDSDSSSSNSSSESSQVQSQEISISEFSQAEISQDVQTTFTDPSGITPAEASKVNNESALSSEFLTTYFNEEVIIDGFCNDASVCGPNADFDEDGMDNILEFNYQTDPTRDDTDGDGVADSDEFIYGTSPKEIDSDGDKIDDLNEIIACSNPALKTFTPVKQLKTDIENISQTVSQRGLQTTTIDSLVEAGATTDDLKLGLIVSNCSTSNIVFSD